jgi:hypothetical protein
MLGTVLPAWEGYCRPPGWVTYKVTYQTLADEFVGSIRIESGATKFGAEVRIPGNSHKEISIPVLFVPGEMKPTIYLEDERGRKIGESIAVNIPGPRPLGAGEIFVGVVGAGEPPDWLDTSRFLENAKILTIAPSEIPGIAEALDPFDILVLPGAPELKTDQMMAVWTWIQSGGVLLLPGPQALEGSMRSVYFNWLFPEFEPGGRIDEGAVLRRWGKLDHRAVFLDSLGLDPERTIPSALGSGRIAFREVGDGGVAFLTEPYSPEGGNSGERERIQGFWTTLVEDILAFGSGSPPNPRRQRRQISLVEPRLYNFFEAAAWPQDRLQWAESVVVIYGCTSVFAILISLLFLIRKRVHFLVASAVCLLGCGAVLILAMPRHTAVGETMEMLALENGKSFAEHRKILHIASLSSSRIDCSFPARNWRIQPVTFRSEDLRKIDARWTFGTRDNPNELAIQGIRLEEGERFMAVVSKATTDEGKFTSTWKYAGRLELKNEINSPLVHGILIRNGMILSLADFEFGQAPREVDLGSGWVPLQEHLAGVEKKAPRLGRILEAYIEGYYREGELLFAAFLKKSGPTFSSAQIDRQQIEMPLVTMTIPPHKN